MIVGLIAMPNFKSAYRFENSNLVSVNMGKATVTLDKPIYLGQAILDISKTLMYNFHYNYVKVKCGDRARLLFTDTDSLCYVIETGDFYEDIREDVPTMFDTSDYPDNHPAGLDRVNKKVIALCSGSFGIMYLLSSLGVNATFVIHSVVTLCFLGFNVLNLA